MARESQSDQIANELRGRINSGTLGPGALVPSEPELARTYGVGRSTARAALQVLEQEGLVIVRPKRGRIVRGFNRLVWRLSEFELPENTGLVSSDAWETDIERQGHDPTRQDLQVETIRPSARVAAILGLNPEVDLCVVRRHLRYIDGEPGIISDDYFDESIVRGTELAAPEDTTREDILKEAGYEQTYDVDEIVTRMPTPDEVARLSISANQPVAEHTRVGHTAGGRPVRLMISIVPGSVLVLRYVVPT
jgi:DNA-binding GntR family transcriptional regulator